MGDVSPKAGNARPCDAPDVASSPATVRARAPMVKAELFGRHTHISSNGVAVHIWRRGVSFMARGRFSNKQYGDILGADRQQAEARLHELLYEIGQGTFIVPSDRNKRALGRPSLVHLTVRQLADEFLTEKRNTLGEKTARDYRNRLVPLIEFAELDSSRKRWPKAVDIDRQFAVEFRTQLSRRQVHRNGRATSQDKPISPHQFYNVLDCARTLINWGRSISIAKLPSTLLNPFTKDIVGQRPPKDPLRKPLYAVPLRIRLVGEMDEWQLIHLAIPMVLPLRPEDYTGLLIGDIDYESDCLSFGTRFSGRDFNKGRVSFVVPYPSLMAPLFRLLASGRTDGPLLRSRAVFERLRQPRRILDGVHTAAWHIEDAVRRAAPSDITAPQDQKRLVRRTIREMGGADGDKLAAEFRQLREKSGLTKNGRLYDLRASISTEVNAAGVSHLVQRYVTGHTTRDILAVYTSLDPAAEMKKYFAIIEPLLDAMLMRAGQLGLRLPM